MSAGLVAALPFVFLVAGRAASSVVFRFTTSTLRALGILAVGIAAFAGISGHALENIRFNQRSVEDGLSQVAVQGIVQDQQGFIWVGTQQGLNRFDGYEFISYYHDSADPASLSDDFIRALHEDADGRIWVGTNRGGLNQLDPLTGKFKRYLHDPADSSTIGGISVRAIVSDAQGRIWAGTDGGGVSRLNAESGTFTRFVHDPDNDNSLSSDRVKALHVDASGFIWVGTDGGGLNRIDPVRGLVTQIPLGGITSERVRAIVSDPRGMLWVGTNEHGLFRVDPQKGVTRHYQFDAENPGSLSSNSIRQLFVDANQQVWVGTDGGGVSLFDQVSDTFTRIQHNSANPRSLSDNHIGAIYQDRGGVIWIGTYRGVNTWNPLMGGFQTFTRREGLPGELSGNLVSSFAEVDDNTILVGTVGTGIDAVDLETGYAQRIDLVDGNTTALSDARVMTLAVGDSGDVWAGTRAGGLNRLDAETGEWQVYRADPDDPSSLAADGVTSLLFADDQHLWVGTFGGGLNLLDISSGRFSQFRHDPADPTSICSDRVLGMLKDQAGQLWVNTDIGGFCRLDADTGRFTRFRHDPEDDTSLSSDAVWALAEDPQGNLWIGTADKGLNLWRNSDRRNDVVRFTRIDDSDGLLSTRAYGILADANGRIWVSNSRGLTRINGDSLLMRHYSQADGLQDNDFSFAAAFRASNGRLFFGGNSGFNAFFPDRIGRNEHPPEVALTRLLKNYEVQAFTELQDEQGRLVLKHTDQHLTIEYSALDFTNPQSNRYQHRLDGFDTDWIDDDGRHRVTYTNLQSGQYLLRVRAANNDGVWSEKELQIPILMLPAPWATWWAQASYVLGLALIIVIGFRIQHQRLARAAELNRVQASLISEITERQVREAELANVRRRAQRYLDVVEVIILALDSKGQVTLVNQKGIRVLGYPEAEILGRNFYDWFVPEEQRDQVRQRFQNIDQYAYSESLIRPKEGSDRMIAWHTIAAPQVDDDPDSAIGGLLISGTDVTQMRALEGQLRDAQKMEALGTLARGVAHDFNNILSSILGYAQLSRAAVADSGQAEDYFDRLESSVDRARDLVARILTFGRGSGQPPQPVRVEASVREAVELLRPVLPANIVLETSLPERSGAVLADPTQLVQVVLNLCTNAAQAMNNDGGVLNIVVCDYTVGIEEARSLSALTPGAHVRISVSDTGPGMDDFTLSRIFDPFFTTRTRDEGTGLGLAQVHGIVSQLRGAVQVFSEPGEGARFDIYLPCCSEQPVDSPVVASEQTSVHGTETVLFVDDEAPVRAIADEALTNLGYKVLLAEDGRDALALFLAHQSEIDVVVTDQTMPNLLGHKLAEQIKKREASVPVVLMSGGGPNKYAHIDKFIEKPFTLTGLGQAVREVLAERSV